MFNTHITFNLFDLIVTSVVAASVLASLFRGFISEVLSIGAWVGAALITLFWVDDATEFLLPFIKDNFTATVFATLGTYLLTLTGLSFFNGTIVKKYIRPGIELGFNDKISGSVLGLVKGWLLVVVGFIIFTFSYEQKAESYPEWVKTASLLPYVEQSATYVTKILPDYLKIPETNIAGNKAGESTQSRGPLSVR